MKKFILHVEEDVKEEFVEALQDLLRGESVIVNVVGGKVEVTVRGSREDVVGVWNDIKRLVRELKFKKSGGVKGETIVRLNVLYSSIGGTIPLEALVEAVEARGGKVEVRGEYVATSLEERELVSLALKIREAIEEVKYQVKGRALKSLIGIISAVTSMTPSQTVKLLEDMDCISFDEEGRALLIKDWKNVLRRVISEYTTRETSSELE